MPAVVWTFCVASFTVFILATLLLFDVKIGWTWYSALLLEVSCGVCCQKSVLKRCDILEGIISKVTSVPEWLLLPCSVAILPWQLGSWEKMDSYNQMDKLRSMLLFFLLVSMNHKIACFASLHVLLAYTIISHVCARCVKCPRCHKTELAFCFFWQRHENATI